MRVWVQGVAALAAGVITAGCTRSAPVLGTSVDAMSAEALRASVSGAKFGECKTEPRTAQSTAPARTPVQICAVEGGQFAGGPSTPVNGVWVARMVNLGNLPTKRWGLKPGPYETWIAAFKYPTRYAMVEMSTASPTDPPRIIIADGNYRHCNHAIQPPRARARFGNCEDHPRDIPPDPAASAVRRGLTWLRSTVMPKTSFAQSPGTLDGPAWIDCGGDCCVTD